MSFRRNMVDYLLSLPEITYIVEDRVSDIFYTFEDVMNSDGNFNKFPAVSVSQSATTTEHTLGNSPVNLKREQLQITVYQSLNVQRFRSKQKSIVCKEEEKITKMDRLTDAIETSLNAFTGQVGSFLVRDTRLIDIRDEEFESEKNRKILAHQILLDFIITKTEGA